MKTSAPKVRPSRWRWAKGNALPKPIQAPLRTVVRHSPDTVTLRLDLRLKFHPGQAISIQLTDDPKKRFFSISSSPTEASFTEITVKTDPAGPFGQALSKLKRGDTLTVEGPMGSFKLPDDLPKNLCFIAAGSGVTPFRSMIKFLLDSGSGTDLWLLHSVKSQAEILFQEDFKTWSGAQKRFHYIPTITQDFDDNWDNETGRIREDLLRKHIPDAPNVYLLCGAPQFVTDVEKILKDTLSVAPERIRREQW